MDPETNLPDLTATLSDSITALEGTLSPLLAQPLSKLTPTLPTLDKAKLHILTAYTLESLIFSALQASGTDAKTHRIFPELARLKGYFAKIKAAEAAATGADKPNAKLDKGAAERFIRHGLAGNERYDRERAERLAKERARAALKARMMVNKKFDEEGEEAMQEELAAARKADRAGATSDDSDESMKEEGEEAIDYENEAIAQQPMTSDDEDASAHEPAQGKNAKKRTHSEVAPDTPTSSASAKKKSRTKKRGSKESLGAGTPKSAQAPRTQKETFDALLAGSLANDEGQAQGSSSGGKKTRRGKKGKK